MENNNEKQEFEFTLVSLFKMFKGKLKMLVAIGVISALLGGTIGALLNITKETSYGNTLTFHLPTAEKNGYATLIPLLESDVFAETILIGTKTVEVTDENFEEVEIEIPSLSFSTEDKNELIKYELEKLKAEDAIKSYKSRLRSLPLEINHLKAELDTKANIYNPYREEYKSLLTVSSDEFAKAEAVEKLKALESDPAYIEAKENYTKAQNNYDAKLTEKAECEKFLFAAKKAFDDANENAESIIKDAREVWAQRSENKKAIKDFNNNVSYRFTKDIEGTKPSANATENGKFLYVEINIPKDEKLAKKIVNGITDNISSFIVENTTPVESNEEIQCIRISSNQVNNLNSKSITSNIAIYAIIFFIAFEAITCIVIIGSHIKKIYLPLINADDEIEAPKAEESEKNSESND